MLQPLARTANLSTAPSLNYNPAAALSTAASNLDLAVVATNTGSAADALATQKLTSARH